MSDSERQWTEYKWCAAPSCSTPVIVPYAFRASVGAIICALHADELTEQQFDAIVRESTGG